MKKLLLTLSSLGVMAGAVTGVASCGTKKTLRFDSENDHLIVLETGLSNTHPGLRALNDIADKWNHGTSEYKLTIRRTEGGYDAQSGFYNHKLFAKDKKTLPNLWMGYADSAALVNKYNMLLDMKSEGMDQSIFNDEIIQPNDHMQNVPKGGLYLIPFAKSTETLVLNKLLLKKIFTTGTLNLSSETISDPNNIWTNIIKNTTLDTTLEKTEIPGWLTTSITAIPADVAGLLKTLVMHNGDNIFSNWNLLLKFTELVGKALGLNSSTSTHHVMGVDSPSNMIMNMAKLYSLNATDEAAKEKFFYNLDNENKKLTWTSLINDYEPGKKAWETISSSVAAGGVELLGKGAYSSNAFKQKNLLMALGSTAGTTYNLSFHSTLRFFNQFQPGTKDDVANKLKGTEIHYIKDCGTTEFPVTVTTDMLCSTDANAAHILGSTKQTITDPTNPPNFVMYVFPKTSINEKTTSHNSKDHDLFLPQPYEIDHIKSAATEVGQHKLIYGQGPNLQAIHANAGEDAAVKKFVKWLFTTKFDWDGKGTTPATTSAIYFTHKSNYISATKELIDTSTNPFGITIDDTGVWSVNADVGHKYLVGPTIAWKSFHKLQPPSGTPGATDPIYHYYVTDTGTSTGEFRNNIGDALRGLTSAHKSGQALTIYSKFIDDQIKWAKTLGYL